ncbi:uncharacterized protein Tco025E_08663 [Trypanosoma conorhini]|uniref:Uncharacterized protein n=1 Tax=Trypanosoma conorhini TaxID=83891 RepID=A0A3R7N6K4_9TRYP|nr:uncharacterized protein Tco025E_08663 [Trypanosoma conorhini]RNF01070.1 hypothetical protein Tco025E_08663 [Trypanosoma conorhini]
MVAPAPRYCSAELPHLCSFTKPQSQPHVNRSEEVHVKGNSLSQLDDTAGSSVVGEEGLTQSQSSENDESEEAPEAPESEYEDDLAPDPYEERGPFEEVYERLRKTPLEIHPFLDMNEQRLLLENERVQRHYDVFLSMGQKHARPLNELGAFSRCLLNEAHRVHVSLVRRYNKTCQEKSLPPKNETEINHQWQCIKLAVEQDLYMEGFAAVQRRLSCMCIFNPNTDERPYGDNENVRHQRLLRQECVLNRLMAQSRKGGSLFLDLQQQ